MAVQHTPLSHAIEISFSSREEIVSVRLRLTRVGGKKDPIWRVVVADQRSPRDGRVIETIGHYNAQTDPSTIVIDEERARSWLARGAQPSDTVRKLLRIQGIAQLGQRWHDGQREPQAAARVPRRRPGRRPEAVAVEQFEEDDGTIVLELCVGAEDYGRMIGRGGRTAHALRTVVKAAAAGEGSTCSSTSSIDGHAGSTTRRPRPRRRACRRAGWGARTAWMAASTSRGRGRAC